MKQNDKKVIELTNDLQRTRADFENYRKQVEAQKQSAKKTVELATVYKILPLLDDIDRAIVTYKELEPLKKSLIKSLEALNLTRVASEEGAEFNPDLHEAVMVEGDGEKEGTGSKGKIIREWNMERLKNIESKLIKWSDETEKLGEYWDDGECE